MPQGTRRSARVPGCSRRKSLCYVFDTGLGGGSIITYYTHERDAFLAAAARQERAETFPLFIDNRAITVVIA